MIPLPGVPYLVAGAFLAGAVATYKVMDWRRDAELKREVEVALNLVKDSTKIVHIVETRVQERIVEVKTKGDTIVREIPKIVTVEVERACPGGLPNAFVRLHDAAGRNVPAGSPSITDPDPSGTTLAQAATTVADNYTAYHACREQVIGWNQFYNDLKARHDAADSTR